jgi:hypothetical protein
MNKNMIIKQVAIEAGLIVGEYNGFDRQELTPAEKRFAELIVRECVDEIKHLRMNYDTHQDVEPEENDWYIDAFLQAEVRLKEHFGVEE